VTYDAIVAVHDDSSRLKPGMTADVIIALTTHKHALAIPAAALLFKPASAGSGGGARGSVTAQTGSSTVAGAPGSRATVWVLRDGKPASERIVIGISDGRNYEVLRGQLKPGDQLIVGQLLTQQYTGTNPIAGGPGLGR
jgi:HlyD family secretion protein